MSAPSILVVVSMESMTPQIIVVATASEADRLGDWAKTQPGLTDLIDAAVRLALPEPAEPASWATRIRFYKSSLQHFIP